MTIVNRERWKRLMPRTMLGLILAGFLVVTLPLIVTLVGSMQTVKSLQERSEALISNEVAFANLSDDLSSQLISMERTARQFNIVRDDALLDLYRDKTSRAITTIRTIKLIPAAATHNETLDQLEKQTRQIAATVTTVDVSSVQLDRVLQYFDEMTPTARDVAAAAESSVSDALRSLDSSGSNARQRLRWQASALIPALGLAIMLFANLISRPVRQVRDSIKGLGEFRTEQSIAIGGPQELAELGEQLDWLRTKLREADAQKDQFLRQMSHELKTPLASIREGVELLLDGSVGQLSTQQHEVASILRDNSIELQHLIENLLSFSALQNRQMRSIQKEQLDLGKLVEQLLRRYHLISSSKKLSFAKHLDVGHIHADHELMRLALDNLISNAVKYSPADGTISIYSRDSWDNVEIEVGDQGPGIPNAERQRIFTAFYQGAIDGKSRVRGTGIGLSVARECIAAHGGSVEVVDGSASGATLRILIPKTGMTV